MATEDNDRDVIRAAAAFFYLHGMFDAMSAPTRWVWSDNDRAANERFNRALGVESTIGAAEWKSPVARKPSKGREDTEWEPHYFPDEDYDLELARRKHDLVMDASIERKEALENLLLEKAEEVGANDLVGAMSNDRFLYSLVQYATISTWVSERVTDFARSPKVREMVWAMWTDAPLVTDPEDVERGQKMLEGGKVYSVSKTTADKLGRIMRGMY